ncbi:MAG: mannose-1-phosphate guanylyltransferase/mannose-6-phosphate isomerase [Elusimicrobia bacterium]|nr:mannose-1-phosphate guanylyltransferase/mannose-6-phosphate isomerase [Elusimicrobiota bacterium]
MNIRVLILAGGSGKRLWPMSREKWPKFMLKFDSGSSLLQSAYERARKITSDENIYIVTLKENAHLIEQDIRRVNSGFGRAGIVTEPEAKNTAPAIMMGIKDFEDDTMVIVLPADHIIRPEEEFRRAVEKAIRTAEQDYIVSIGIEPQYPSTGYGYIKRAAGIGEDAWRIDRFKEKPDFQTAREYVESRQYYWNAGIFIFKSSVMKAEMKRLNPVIYEMFGKMKNKDADVPSLYKKMPAISIDYAVMEKTARAAVVPYRGGWDDLGSWEAVHAVVRKDRDGNSTNSEGEMIDTSNTYICTEPGKFVSAIGVEDIIVVDTKDAILVMKRGSGQKVKDIVDMIGGREVAMRHMTDYRPWGNYRVLDEGKGFKVKILEIYPGQRLSLQKHRHRDESWTLMRGDAVITLDKDSIEPKPGETLRIPAGKLHRAENRGSDSVMILELATGEKIEEDDIVRVEDDYERT